MYLRKGWCVVNVEAKLQEESTVGIRSQYVQRFDAAFSLMLKDVLLCKSHDLD